MAIRQTRKSRCLEKIRYPKKSDANTALKLLKLKKKCWDDRLGVYRCDQCGLFHIGHIRADLNKLFETISNKEELKINRKK